MSPLCAMDSVAKGLKKKVSVHESGRPNSPWPVGRGLRVESSASQEPGIHLYRNINNNNKQININTTIPLTHMGILVLGKEIVGVARLATTCATFTLNDTSLASPLGSEMSNLEGKGLITIKAGGTGRGT